MSSTLIKLSQQNSLNHKAKANNKQNKNVSFGNTGSMLVQQQQPLMMMYNPVQQQSQDPRLKWAVVATTNLLQGGDVLAHNLDKSKLYDKALEQSDSLSNPTIKMLIDASRAVDDAGGHDNKLLADAVPKPGTNWRQDPRFNQLAAKGMQELQQKGALSKQTVDTMTNMVKAYYTLPERVSELKKLELTGNLADYNQAKTKGGELLKEKVPPQYIKAANHIVQNWKNLLRETPKQTKSSLIPLPKPFIIPGGRFDEIYYWDSYFTILGLNKSGDATKKVAKGMVENFMYMTDKLGFIPNGNRVYYLSRSQPPFLPQMIEAVRPTEKEIKTDPASKAWMEKAYKSAVHEYKSEWMDGPEYVKEYGLNRYFDQKDVKRLESWSTDNLETPNTKEFFMNERTEAETGWDFSDRFKNRCTEHLPVDLNAILFKNEKTFEKWANMLGREDEAKQWSDRADFRKQQMQKLMWNDATGMFSDYDMKEKKVTDYKSLAGTFPLWAEVDKPLEQVTERDHLCTAKQARKVRDNLVQNFEFDGGLVNSLGTPNVDRQWNYPNGWPSTECIAIDGLEKQGFLKDAKRISQKWLDLNTKVFYDQGKFIEKYNVVRNSPETGGTYPLQDGFGWTNGVYLHLLNNVAAKY